MIAPAQTPAGSTRASACESSSGTSRSLRLAYLTTVYPEVSHTFIRRELVALAHRGHEVLRFSIRRSRHELIDADDAEEAARTVYVLDQGVARLLAVLVLVAVRTPRAFVRAVTATLAMSRASDRGLIRHAAYLVEACYLRRAFRRARVEHVHVHFGTNAATVARLVHRLGGPDYSITMHGSAEFSHPSTHSLGAKVADAAFVVTVSDYGQAELRRWTAPGDWKKIHVVHCTVGDEFLRDETSPVPSSCRNFVCIGRLSPEKGHCLLLEAFSRLVDRGAHARLVLAGEGNMRETIERRVATLGLNDVVTLEGAVNGCRVRELLHECRACVLASFMEGLPVVLMEAMAHRRPVIAPRVAGIPELVRDGESGLLFRVGDVDQLTNCLERLLVASTTKLDAMGELGRLRVLQRHQLSSELDKIETLFHSHIVGDA